MSAGLSTPAREAQHVLRLKHSRSSVLAVVFGLVLSEIVSPAAGATTDTGPTVLPCAVRLVRIVPVAPRTYSLELASLERGPADVLVTLYSHTHSYKLPLPAQTFTEKATPSSQMLRTSPIFFTMPDDDVIEAALADPLATGAAAPQACVTSHLIALDALRPVAPRPLTWPTAAELEARNQLVRLFADGRRATAAATFDRDETAPTCAQPYQPVHTLVISHADYPATAVAQGAAGFVTVEVILDRQGKIEATRVLRSSGWASLDDESVRAASRTTYAPEIFRCEAVPGFYAFVADFTRA